ncbi:MAG TPA: efflux RND transporter periplasmic adaptor subunit [Pyrinomonadaceae bacterium]|nr:efflux RND transporter periplasmic adaptor subunit [Pyrinomonadaceae bacterium]
MSDVATRDESQRADQRTAPGVNRKLIAVIVALALVALVVVVWLVIRSSKGTQQTNVATAKSAPPTVATTTVVSQTVNKELHLPGELRAFQDVAIYPKVQSFVESINIDRGSVVRRGQLLVRMSAPELASHTSEAEARVSAAQQQRFEMESRVQSVREQRAEAEAKLVADEGTYKRLKAASATPGVVAENDVDVARGVVEGDRARIRALEDNEKAARAVVQSQIQNERATRAAANSVRDIESYLRITAPFAGVVTERNVDKGSLAGPSTGPSSMPMLRLQEISRLRLVVSVPEADVSGVAAGSRINFTVPAFPGEKFFGVVQRISHTLDEKTRTMPVELDVINDSARLAPGMFPEVIWPTTRPQPSLFVPASAIATTTERTFVIRIRNGTTDWVDVKRGVSMGDLVEVFGDLQENDVVAARGTDELRAGISVNTKQSPSPK